MKKRLLSALLALCMMLTMMPTVAFAAEGEQSQPVPLAEGDVAQIGNDTYPTLKDAIDASENGDTITLLGNCKLPTTNFPSGKTLVIDGTSSSYTIDADTAYLNIAGDVTFQNCELNMHGVPSGNWMYIYMASNGILTFDNADVTIDGTDADDNTAAMYFPEPNTPCADVNIKNSTVEIKNCRGNGISWGGSTNNGNNQFNIDSSTVTIDNCAEKNTSGGGGIVGTFDITLTDSDLTVKNNKGYGSNGSHFIIKDSTVDFSDNGSHGLSAGELSIDHSTVTANNNKGMGITVNENFTVKDNSNVEVTGNASNSSYGYAAVRLYNDKEFSVDSTSTLTIKDNHNTGLYVRQGNLTVEDGAKLTITGNKVTHTLLDGYGGGVYVGYGDNYDPTVTLPADAAIYNNHSLIGGDDIYVSEGVNGPSLTFGEVGSNWQLDGDPDCTDAIDGWYDDSEGARWEAHTAPYHAEEQEMRGVGTITGLVALKAAHGLLPVDPDDNPPSSDWETSKSKTVTNLDENYESEVTLSLPADSYKPSVDVVMVIDVSSSMKEVDIAEAKAAARTMCDELAAKENVDTNIGIVTFDKTSQNLTNGLVSIDEAKSAIDQIAASSDTNMMAGLMAGKAMLDAGSGTDKYMVLMSDGIPIYWMENGEPVSKTLIRYAQDGTTEISRAPAGTEPEGSATTDFASMMTMDEILSAIDWDTDSNEWKQISDTGEDINPACKYTNIQKATYKTAQYLIDEIFGQYKLKMVAFGTDKYENNVVYQYGENFCDWIGKQDGVSYYKIAKPGYGGETGQLEDAFKDIADEMIYVVDAGSKVIDVIGADTDSAGNDYDFAFVNNLENLKLTVGGKELAKTDLTEDLGFTDPNETARYGFGESRPEQMGGYPFVLHYYEKGEDGQSDECFVWDINVPVEIDNTVQLTYTVKLTNPQSEEGIYGQYDADGSEDYDGLYTNNRATLYPVDSNGDEGVPENFAKPTVSYTVGKIKITPADITIYTGGTGYDGVVNGDGNEIGDTNNGLPTPGFYITLPDAVNEWLLANVDDAYKVENAEGDEIVDLSHFLKFTYNQNGESRTWELKRYDDKPNDNNSMAYNQFIYRIEPAVVKDPETGEKEKIPIRLQFTDGNEFMTSDDFAVNLNDLFHTYDMSIYAGDLNRNLVKAVLTVNNQPVEYSAVVESGKLTVRGVTDNGTHTTEVVTKDPATEVSSVTAQVDEGTTFRINGSQLEVEDGSKVKLLVDSMVPDSNNTLVNSAVNEFDAIPDDYNHQTRYLDLVDTSNGNVYVTASDTVTLYWAYPEGTDKNTEFHLVHYEGLDRNNNDALENGTYNMELYSVEEGNLENTDQGIKITVDSFSPFALFWEDDNSGGGGGGSNNKPDDLNTEDHFAYIIGYPKDYRTGEPTDDESLWPVEPQGNITRAEVATIFFRMLTDEARDRNWSQTNSYTDVDPSDWYNNAISTLSNMGIISGDPSGAFRPDDSITRAEFTKIAVGFFDKAGDYVDGTYDDVSSSDWYADFIDAAVDLGLIEGYPDGTIRPEATITRAEACTIVNRTLGRVPDKDHLLPADEMRVWPDNSDTNEWYYAQIQEATNSHDYEWIGEENDQIENWTEKLEDRDWAQLEREWSDANSAPGGEVVD